MNLLFLFGVFIVLVSAFFDFHISIGNAQSGKEKNLYVFLLLLKIASIIINFISEFCN